MAAGKTYLSANEYLSDTWRLAAKVRNSGWRPDVLVALWRGGAPVGVSIHEFFKVTGWNVRHFPLRCASYTGIGTYGECKVEDVMSRIKELGLAAGSKVLLIDDVFDTGKTAVAVRAEFVRAGLVASDIRLACVYWKSPANTTNMTPDYYVRDVGMDWIVFPHEIEGLTADEVATKNLDLSKLLGEIKQ